MGKDNKNENKSNIVMLISVLVIILVVFLIFRKAYNDRINYKKSLRQQNNTTENTYVNNQNNINNGSDNDTNNNYDRPEKTTIDKIDIPKLFGNDNYNNNDKKTENKVRENNIQQNTNKKTNTKDEEQEEKDNGYEKILPTNKKTALVEIRKDAQQEVAKSFNSVGGDVKKAKNLYLLNTIRKIALPICVLAIIISFVYEYIFGLKTKKVWESGKRIRVFAIITLLITQILPFIYSLIVKGWGN